LDHRASREVDVAEANDSMKTVSGSGFASDPLTGSTQYCKCGWLVPNSSTVVVTLDEFTHCEVVSVEMACPECGNVFEINDLTLLREN
jgi:hypothetical protein